MASKNTLPNAAPSVPALVDLRWLQQEYGLKLSRVQIWRLVRNGVLPLPIKLSRGHSAKMFWRRTDIEAAFAKRQGGARASVPASHHAFPGVDRE